MEIAWKAPKNILMKIENAFKKENEEKQE